MPDYPTIVFVAAVVAAIGFIIYVRSKRSPTSGTKPRGSGSNVKPRQPH